MTALQGLSDPLRLRLDAFLSGAERIETDRRIYCVLLIAGCALVYVTSGDILTVVLVGWFLLVDETYHRHLLRARRRPTQDLGRRDYIGLLVHYAVSIVSFSAIAVSGAMTGTAIGAGIALLLAAGQILNSISYETRARETAIIAAVVIALTGQICIAGIAYSHGLSLSDWIVLTVGAGLLSVYCTHVLLETAATRRDLTERTAALVEAARAETVGRLTSGIAHDFNNLLTVMRGNLDLIHEVPDVDRPLLLRDIADAADRGGRLVHRLLDQNRRGLGDRVRVSLPDFLAAFTTFARRVMPSNIRIVVTCAPDLALETQPHLLEAALLNVLVNARDALPDGGRIDIAATSDPSRDVEPQDVEMVSFCIEDNGHGMDAAVLDRATDALTTTKPAGKGTGLGLAMVRDFVSASGGHLTIDSTPGQGTTVILSLPAR